MQSKAELKQAGFIPQKQEGYFSLRAKVSGGHLTAANLAVLAQLAEKYGRGEVHLTCRQSLEIPHIHIDSIDDVKEALATAGMAPAELGPKIRTFTACPGANYCHNGITYPQQMATFLRDNLSDKTLPHKFKLGLSGCRNNCLKAEENDAGLKGGLVPRWERPQDCTYCGICQKVCPVDAISIDKDKKELIYDAQKCVQCGLCNNKCPHQCWGGDPGWHIFFGGVFGQNILIGRKIFPIITDEASVLATVEKSLDFFREHCHKGERLGRAIVRVGWDKFEKFMA